MQIQCKSANIGNLDLCLLLTLSPQYTGKPLELLYIIIKPDSLKRTKSKVLLTFRIHGDLAHQ